MKSKLLVGVIVIWFVGVTAAFAAVLAYKTTPGKKLATPATWPADSSLQLTSGGPNVIMFVHPQCPCTKASMAELARLANELDTRAKFQIVIVEPEDAPGDFDEGTIKERASAIPHAQITLDHGARESRRFGALTSGATLLYSETGKLLFSGGLTSARGHEGRAVGTRQIVALVRGQSSIQSGSPVYGCALEDPNSIAKQ